jgi:predicted methyltransferase
MLTRIQGLLVCLALGIIAVFASAASHAADIYDTAVQHAGRSADDLQRDQSEHPAELLRLTGIKSGMRVADVMAGGGYYSELLSYLVGPSGHVLLLNNTAYDKWSEGGWEKRLAGDRSTAEGIPGSANGNRSAAKGIPRSANGATWDATRGNRLPNVEHRTVDLQHLDLPDHSLDALLLIKVYHDFYWIDADPKAVWPKMDAAVVLDQLTRVLKPGGVVLLEDHSAKAGTGSAAAGTLHRIDEAYTVRDFEKRGFKLIGKSDLLRRPQDERTLVSYTSPGLGKTDRFVLVFRKNAS